ncbi:MAG: hypothetical protein K8I00_01705 [Candidatus Omnitrophica bacterium]|nr:hypothetical protein [Candidatus Omnitrophota bacterium]
MQSAFRPKQFILAAIGFSLVGVVWAAAQNAADLPITRQTETEMEKAFMQILSGKRVRKQERDETYPEVEKKVGQSVSAYLPVSSILDVFVPFSARSFTDEDINRILRKAVIVEYEDLNPLALKPCEIIHITDTQDRGFDLCVFAAPDHRGTLTFPNYQRFWFAVKE